MKSKEEFTFKEFPSLKSSLDGRGTVDLVTGHVYSVIHRYLTYLFNYFNPWGMSHTSYSDSQCSPLPSTHP